MTITRRAALAAPLLPLLAHAREARAANPRVVATFTILQDVAARVAGAAAEVATLVPRDGDPHAFEPRPSDLGGLRRAAAVVQNGLGLEGWLGRTVEASGFNGVLITASAGITPRSLEENGASVPDPHIWQDPTLAQRMVKTIADGMVKADPPHAALYRQASADYVQKLDLVDAGIKQALAGIAKAKRRVLTTHDAFAYYGARYGIEFVALQGISADAEPSPRRLAQVAAQAKAERIGVVFLENMTDPRLAQVLAREAGLRVGPKLYSDSLSPKDGPAATYIDMLRYNTAQFAASMA